MWTVSKSVVGLLLILGNVSQGKSSVFIPLSTIPPCPESLQSHAGKSFRISERMTCVHWETVIPKRYAELTPKERAMAEADYREALRLAVDVDCPTNPRGAYDALERAARKDHGKAQFLVAFLWDFGTVSALRRVAPSFEDVAQVGNSIKRMRFLSDHFSCCARARRRGGDMLKTPVVNGDFARQALFWYSRAEENGVVEATPLIASLRQSIDHNLQLWSKKRGLDIAKEEVVACCRWIMDDSPLHQPGDPCCSTGLHLPKHLRERIRCTCSRYRDVGIGSCALVHAASSGCNGAAQLAVALREESRVSDGAYSAKDELFESLKRSIGRAGVSMQWTYPKNYLTNDVWCGYVEGLYQRAIDLGETNAFVQLTRFKRRVATYRARVYDELCRAKHIQEATARRKRTEDARRPLFYPGEAKEKFEIAGFTLGDSYEPDLRGGQVFYGDTLNRHMFQKQADPPFFGMDKVSGFLSPSSHRLGKLELRTTSFSGRLELISAGRSVLKALSSRYGYRLAPFRFESPDHPYWPSRKTAVWSGPLPSLYAVDPSAWPTGKTIFAFSDTRIGSVAIHVELSVVDHDEYTMGVKLEDLACLADSEAEFQEAFRKKHNGQTWEEWNRETSFKASWYYKFNERRQPFKGRILLAGWTLGAVVDTNNYTGTVFHGRIAGWQADAMLKDSFLDGYTHIGLAVDSSNRVDNIVLKSARTKDVDKALELLKNTKQFFLDCGMDDYYDEKWSSRSEILAHVSPPNKNVWGARSLCSLDWVDKTRSLWVRLNLESEQQNGVTCYVAVYRGKFDSHHEYLWQNCLRAKQKREKERQGGCD